LFLSGFHLVFIWSLFDFHLNFMAEQSCACKNFRGKLSEKYIQKEKDALCKELFLAGSKLLMFKLPDNPETTVRF